MTRGKTGADLGRDPAEVARGLDEWHRGEPEEAVVAYVRNAKRGEVTVMSGTREVTYRDPALVKRLLRAAPGAS